VEPLGRHPLYRALRPDKTALVMMDQVLQAHQSGKLTQIPLYAMLSEPVEALARRARRIARRLKESGIAAACRSTRAALGGGTTPEETMPSYALVLPGGQRLLDGLRENQPAVVGRIEDDAVILDMRTVFRRQDQPLTDAILATYGAIELRPTGQPIWLSLDPVELYDLLPYGVGCFEFEAGDNLRHPRLFIDPQSGNPHVFATDLASCHFQILEIQPTVEDEVVEIVKRRRQIIILRHATAIALRPDLPLKSGRLEIGSGLSLLMHWDAEEGDAVLYQKLDEEGISATKALVLDEDLDHERAVDLIREMAKR
jgi:hypothetical protein